MPKEPAEHGGPNSESEPGESDATPFDRFEELAKKLLAVPKHEVDEARAARKARN